MAILKRYYPNEDHVFVFDNATIYLKHPQGSPSATKMLNPLKDSSVDANALDVNMKPTYSKQGQFLKKRIHILNGRFDGRVSGMELRGGLMAQDT